MAEQKVIMTDPRQEDYFYQEAIKTLRTNIQFAGMDVKTILFTSCYPNEGKSDITFQLSQEIGKLGKKVLLLDADIRKSILASRYGVGKQVQGLSNYLSGQASIAEIIYRTNYGYHFFRFICAESVRTAWAGSVWNAFGSGERTL